MPRDIVILGPPGAGKGTQAQRISEEAGIPHVATGDLIRAEIAAGTELGRQVESYNARGDLVPDEILIGPFASGSTSPTRSRESSSTASRARWPRRRRSTR